jgi:serine/threonine-protein kinase Chk1
MTFTTVDKRKCPLNGDVLLQEISLDYYLVVFKRTKVILFAINTRQGDPLEFKRLYKAVVERFDFGDEN